MTYQTEVDFHPLFELVSSMSVFLSQKSHYDVGQQWFKEMESKISPTFKAHMKDEELMRGEIFLLIMLWKCPNRSTLSEFLAWFQAFSIGELYEFLYPYFDADQPKDLGAFRDGYCELLKNWSEVYSFHDGKIKALEEIAGKLKEESKGMDSVEFVEKCTNGIRIFPVADLRQVILVPSFYTAPLNRVYSCNEMMFIHFAVDEPAESAMVPTIGFMRRTKALADPKRLRILQLLAAEAKTFTEIGKEMKLSKSNLHYHLTLLRTAGLVRITNYKFNEPDKYQTRRQGFAALNEDIETYVFRGK